MLKLKDYQEWALDALREYFQECSRTENTDTSFYTVTHNTFGQGIPYNPVEELPGLPYVCLRIPTGGGKTIVACHSIGTAAKELVHTECPLVLWIVPSNAILEQTVQALRNRKHPYRQAVESAGGTVNVLDIEAALYVNRAELDGETTIIITTMQAFRVEDTVGRLKRDFFMVIHHGFFAYPIKGWHICCSPKLKNCGSGAGKGRILINLDVIAYNRVSLNRKAVRRNTSSGTHGLFRFFSIFLSLHYFSRNNTVLILHDFS